MNPATSRYYDGWHDALDVLLRSLPDEDTRRIVDRLRFAAIAQANERADAPDDADRLAIDAAGALVQTLLDYALDDRDPNHIAVTALARQAAAVSPPQAAEAITLLALLTAHHITEARRATETAEQAAGGTPVPPRP